MRTAMCAYLGGSHEFYSEKTKRSLKTALQPKIVT